MLNIDLSREKTRIINIKPPAYEPPQFSSPEVSDEDEEPMYDKVNSTYKMTYEEEVTNFIDRYIRRDWGRKKNFFIPTSNY